MNTESITEANKISDVLLQYLNNEKGFQVKNPRISFEFFGEFLKVEVECRIDSDEERNTIIDVFVYTNYMNYVRYQRINSKGKIFKEYRCLLENNDAILYTTQDFINLRNSE